MSAKEVIERLKARKAAIRALPSARAGGNLYPCKECGRMCKKNPTTKKHWSGYCAGCYQSKRRALIAE